MLLPPKVAIIILNWNGLKDTLSCLSSVTAIDYPNFEVIVVDNGSSDGSVKAIQNAYPHFTLIQNKENLGFAEGNNQGIQLALDRGHEYILLLNNDTVVDPQILQAFIHAFSQNPEAGILGAKIYLFDKKDTLDHWGGKWNSRTAEFDLIGLRQSAPGDDYPSEQIDYVCGAALIAKRQVFEKIGLLEKKFFLIWEESDFCFRAAASGFKTFTCPPAKIWHKVSASFVGKPHSTYFWWRNRLLWIQRNCSKKELLSIYIRILIPSIIHIYKIHAIKTVQLKIIKKMRPLNNTAEKENKLLKNRAALQGVQDYFKGRFGNAPAWIYQNFSE